MPLMQGKGPKAFKKNIEVEMQAGKPQKQSLAIAYSVKRKNMKRKAAGGSVESGSRDMNMAEGGDVNDSLPSPKPGDTQDEINRKRDIVKQQINQRMQYANGGEISASNEKRPMPDNRYDDAKMISKNSSRKSNGQDGWLDQPTVAQAQKNNGRAVLPIARPKMVPSDAFSTRLYNKEGMLEESAKPGPYGEQPEKDMDEEGPDRQGPKVPDMQDEHSTKAKPYAKGGEIEESDKHSPINKYEDNLLDLPPSEDEGDEMAMSHNEMDADGHGDDVPDMEDEHSTSRKPYAGGGKIGDDEQNIADMLDLNPAHDKHSSDDSEDQPDEEEREEHHNSIAAAIMSKKKAKEAQMSDSDIDEMMHLYEGGEINEHSGKILSHDSIYSDDSDMADMSRNHDEDANEEDQLSFNALRKENYNDSNLDKDQPRDSNLKGDSEEEDSENRHDMISAIRRRMSKKQF